MTYARLDGLNPSYEDLGRRDGPPLVLLHGFTVTGRPGLVIAWRTAEVWEAYVASLQGSSVLVTWEKATDLHPVGDDGWSSRQASILRRMAG